MNRQTDHGWGRYKLQYCTVQMAGISRKLKLKQSTTRHYSTVTTETYWFHFFSSTCSLLTRYDCTVSGSSDFAFDSRLGLLLLHQQGLCPKQPQLGSTVSPNPTPSSHTQLRQTTSSKATDVQIRTSPLSRPFLSQGEGVCARTVITVKAQLQYSTVQHSTVTWHRHSRPPPTSSLLFFSVRHRHRDRYRCRSCRTHSTSIYQA